MNEFDLGEPAPNGLRRGYTTGSCATAGVLAALWKLHHGENLVEALITLPEGDRVLRIPVLAVETTQQGARARVVKDAGDDPDQTHLATIVVEIAPCEAPGIHFRAGEGVGTIRQPGLQLPVGEPAINPVPRMMMRQTVEAFCADLETAPTGYEIRVGCEGGDKIAQKTFNPRLGIEGGISILGTTGIVEPKSMAAFKASIEVYINVAIADEAEEVVFSPGNLGQRFARENLALEPRRVVQISNFVGFSLDHLAAGMSAQGRSLPVLWIVGHPGKLAKLIDGHWDTHSKASPPATEIVSRIANDQGLDPDGLNTVEEAVSLYAGHASFWEKVAQDIRKRVAQRVGDSADDIRVRLFSMAGRALNR